MYTGGELSSSNHQILPVWFEHSRHFQGISDAMHRLVIAFSSSELNSDVPSPVSAYSGFKSAYLPEVSYSLYQVTAFSFQVSQSYLPFTHTHHTQY